MTHRDLPHFANLRDGGNLYDADDIDVVISVLRWLRAASAVGVIVLLTLLFANKALPQAAYDAVNHEVRF